MPQATPTSRAAPRCRTCHEPMKGHGKTDCAKSTSTTITQVAEPLLAEFESASCALTNEGGASAGDSVSRILPVKTYDGATSALNAQPAPPTIEETIGFLLGLHHPIDPARIRFALSLLDQMEACGVSALQDKICATEPNFPTVVASSKRQKRALHRKPDADYPTTALKLRAPLTYLVTIVMTSILTTILLAQV